MRKLNIPKDLLKELYCEKGMTLQEVAKFLDVSRQTVSNKLAEYSIQVKNSAYKRSVKVPKKRVLKKIPPYRNKGKFEEAYFRLKSLDLVAEYFGINQKTAAKWKLKHGISTVRKYSIKGRENLNKGKPYANKEWLEDMYAKYSFSDIARMMNCHDTTIQKWAKKLGIKSRSISEQWDMKSKNGTHVVKQTFDLQRYKNTYSMCKDMAIPKGLKSFIISLYGKCECCGYSEVLDLHHIDGDHRNNDPSNHAVLCPNCHAKIHRLGVSFNELVPNHVTWDSLVDSYSEAK